MRIENIAVTEVALTKLKFARNFTLYIGNTMIRQFLDFTSAKFQSVRSLHLILENNPDLKLQGLSLDGTWAVETFYNVLEIRGRGLKSFHKD